MGDILKEMGKINSEFEYSKLKSMRIPEMTALIIYLNKDHKDKVKVKIDY
jgi:hypothetical protein